MYYSFCNFNAPRLDPKSPDPPTSCPLNVASPSPAGLRRLQSDWPHALLWGEPLNFQRVGFAWGVYPVPFFLDCWNPVFDGFYMFLPGVLIRVKIGLVGSQRRLIVSVLHGILYFYLVWSSEDKMQNEGSSRRFLKQNPASRHLSGPWGVQKAYHKQSEWFHLFLPY